MEAIKSLSVAFSDQSLQYSQLVLQSLCISSHYLLIHIYYLGNSSQKRKRTQKLISSSLLSTGRLTIFCTWMVEEGSSPLLLNSPKNININLHHFLFLAGGLVTNLMCQLQPALRKDTQSIWKKKKSD